MFEIDVIRFRLIDGPFMLLLSQNMLLAFPLNTQRARGPVLIKFPEIYHEIKSVCQTGARSAKCFLRCSSSTEFDSAGDLPRSDCALSLLRNDLHEEFESGRNSNAEGFTPPNPTKMQTTNENATPRYVWYLIDTEALDALCQLPEWNDMVERKALSTSSADNANYDDRENTEPVAHIQVTKDLQVTVSEPFQRILSSKIVNKLNKIVAPVSLRTTTNIQTTSCPVYITYFNHSIGAVLFMNRYSDPVSVIFVRSRLWTKSPCPHACIWPVL